MHTFGNFMKVIDILNSISLTGVWIVCEKVVQEYFVHKWKSSLINIKIKPTLQTDTAFL